MNAPFKTDTLPEWRLDDLYAGREDPRIETDLARANADSLYFTLELNQLEDAEIAAALKAHPAAARWSPWLRRVRLGRPHELSPDLERMLVDRGPAVANWSRLFDETLAHLTTRVGRE